jgi:hypothetical protein
MAVREGLITTAMRPLCPFGLRRRWRLVSKRSFGRVLSNGGLTQIPLTSI